MSNRTDDILNAPPLTSSLAGEVEGRRRPGEDLPGTGDAGSHSTRPYWLGLGIIVIGAVWVYGALALPQTAQYAQIGPGLFVMVIGVGLIGFGALLTWQIARGEEFKAQDSEDAMADMPADKAALLTAVAATALPLLTMQYVGFPLTATLCFALVARAFGSRRPALDLAIGALLALLAYFGFIQLGVTLGGLFPLLDI